MDARGTLRVGSETYEIFRLDALQERVGRRAAAVHAARPARERAPSRASRRTTPRRSPAGWRPTSRAARSPSGRAASSTRTSPASRRSSTSRRCANAMQRPRRRRGRASTRVIPAELVIDHSVQVDEFATEARLQPQRRARVRAQPRALRVPALGPGGVRRLQGRPARHRHRPPGQPRVPRAGVVESRDGQAFPDTLVGTDSHTTMVNGLGVLGWGVGGIEAEAAMLGEPLSMLVPQVVGFRLDRRAAARARPRPTSS